MVGKKVFPKQKEERGQHDITEEEDTNSRNSIKKRKRKDYMEDENNKDSPQSTTEFSEIDSEKKKKEKKSKQKAIPKKKAPLDLDRQCGVLIPPNNHPCTRSLTCKIHSMGAKRAVEGRSQPFNDLLAAYQKKGIGRPQVPGNDPLKSKSIPDKKNMHKSESKEHDDDEEEEEDEVDEEVDSDAEAEHIRLAIEQTKPLPLCQRQVFYVRRKRAYFKLRDILLDAIRPKHDHELQEQFLF
ncbi:SCA7, zinc-binding domain-containing protein [Gilbertella persicaria]|uniref:SCA7, zinc-binding domain-containing protein n=1 Tax=Gilbertella persicaria TaxID=101096 RepID=UPI0022204D83|nr:SCA7, zinc-binding domain-containing protein [Gilbertella persicaria]KAI8047085.1 SCA7, zinc-binding domain-containing protein [Gilbertella persicaria]